MSVDLNALSPTVAGCGPIANPSAFPNSPDLPQSLKSYSDWDKVNLVFVPDGDSQDGVTQRVSQPFINKNTQELKPVFLQSIQDVALQIQFVPPPNPDGSSTFKTGSTVPLKFNLKDKNGISIPNAVVTLVAEKGSGTIVGSTPFVYSPATAQYKYEWITPKGGIGGRRMDSKVYPKLPQHESSPTRISVTRTFRHRTVYTKDNRHKIVEANSKGKEARGFGQLAQLSLNRLVRITGIRWY